MGVSQENKVNPQHKEFWRPRWYQRRLLGSGEKFQLDEWEALELLDGAAEMRGGACGVGFWRSPIVTQKIQIFKNQSVS